MLPLKPILSFFLRLVLLYALLVAPWPGLRACYGSGYRTVMNALFGSFGSDGIVRFEALAGDVEQVDTEIIAGNRRTRARPISALHSTAVTGYLPTAEVVALIVATPIPWSRRWKSLLWGLLLVNGLVILRVAIALLYGFSGDHPIALYSPGPVWIAVLAGAHRVFATWINFSYVAPLFIWIVVTFRRSDWERLLGARSSLLGENAAPGSVASAESARGDR